MGTSYAQGADFSVERHGSVLVCRVWPDPKLSDVDAMRKLIGKAAVLSSLHEEDGLSTALVLDLRGRVNLSGAFPTARLSGLARHWNGLDRPVSVVVADAVQKLQAERACAGSSIRVVTEMEDAVAWARLATRLAQPSTAA